MIIFGAKIIFFGGGCFMSKRLLEDFLKGFLGNSWLKRFLNPGPGVQFCIPSIPQHFLCLLKESRNQRPTPLVFNENPTIPNSGALRPYSHLIQT